MENQHQKIANIGYLAFAVLVAFILLTGMMKVADLYDLESKVKSIDLVIRGASVAIGAIVFFTLYRNHTVNSFTNEVVSELITKVSWPTSKETTTATIVVIITVIIAGLVLAFFDWVWVMTFRWLI